VIFVSNFSADGACSICHCFTAVRKQAGPIARKSGSECGPVASCFCVKEVLWIKMESLQSMGDISGIICIKQVLQK